MCGIAGVIGEKDTNIVREMLEKLLHRGPDGSGFHASSTGQIGATRLSIIDPESGAQLIYSSDKQACIVFNGEIYNYRELRRELERDGFKFKTNTDTEVVMRLYEAKGDACVHLMHGMFAFAILDRGRLLLARDRSGIKPLYYTYLPHQGQFIFASEIKAILLHRDVPAALDVQAFADSVVLGYPTGAATFFKDIQSLLPGHTMSVIKEEGGIMVGEPIRYHQRTPTPDLNLSLEDAEELLAAELARAVSTHLSADVEVGLTLSGGIDSVLLALFAGQVRETPLRTFTVGDHETFADLLLGEQVAHAAGCIHEPVILGWEQYLAAIPGLAEVEEQPSSLYGMPFYLLCQRIGSNLKACLHGEGADELFGGYGEYMNRTPRLSHIRQRLPVLRHLGIGLSTRALRTIERLSQPVTFETYLPNVFQVNFGDALERQHLMPVDKCAMSAGVEMRVPYLDDGVVALVQRMPLSFLVRHDLGVKKYILRRLALKQFGVAALDSVLREKLGAPVAGLHLLDRFDRLCNENLPDSYVEQHGFGPCFRTKRELLMFDLFTEIFMTHRGDSSAVGGILDFLASRAGRKSTDVRYEHE